MISVRLERLDSDWGSVVVMNLYKRKAWHERKRKYHGTLPEVSRCMNGDTIGLECPTFWCTCFLLVTTSLDKDLRSSSSFSLVAF